MRCFPRSLSRAWIAAPTIYVVISICGTGVHSTPYEKAPLREGVRHVDR